jgi:signal peptidase II
VLAADIISKMIVVATLATRQVRLLGGLVTLLETRNPGAAFSLGGPSETIVFSVIAVGVVIYIIRASRRIYSIAWAVALGLLLGGATGNLTDRIFRAPAPFRGWVVDWIEVPHWPVFNLADSAITCGGVLMVVLAVLGRGIEGKPRPASHPEEPGPELADPAGQQAGADEPVSVQTEPDGPLPQQKPGTAERVSEQKPGADDPGPEHSGPGHSVLERPVPEPSAAKPAEPDQAQPQWPEPGQPTSQWPRSEWPDAEQSGAEQSDAEQSDAEQSDAERSGVGQSWQEHPAQGNSG